MTQATSDFPGLDFSIADGLVVARYTAQATRTVLSGELLRSLLVNAGYGNCVLDEGLLLALIERCNSANEDFGLVIGESRDGSFSIEIAADSMTAMIDFLPPQGGRAVMPVDVLLALREAHVVFGVIESAVMDACNSGVAIRIVAAEGVPPVDGEDSRFELLIEQSRERVPKVDNQGLVDFREQGEIPVVQAGQALMRRIPAAASIDGHTVRGELLAGRLVANHPFAENLIGAAPSADDPNLLVALFNGQPVLVGNGVAVDEVLQVTNVSIASGNISFDGTVVVTGDVLTDMKVKASGDIIVKGTVDGGHLEAGGQVLIAGGLISHATVHAETSVTARFAEGSQIFAGTVIAIEDTALKCELQALNQILIGTKNPQRGRLVGGSARAMLKICTPLLGAEAAEVTHVMVGVNPTLEQIYRELLQAIEKQGAEEEKLQKLLAHLTHAGDKGGMKERVRSSYENAARLWADLLGEKEVLEKQMSLTKGARVEVSQGVAGAVDLAFGQKTLRFRHRCNAGAFVLVDDRVAFTDPSGEILEF